MSSDYKYNTNSMVWTDRSELFFKLRNQHAYFCFERFELNVSKTQIVCTYHFSLDGIIDFHPTLTINSKSFYKNWPDENSNRSNLEQLFFNVGMVELISYWKAACPKRLIIKPFSLEPGQIAWWKKLYHQGLGEFFYLNCIQIEQEDMMEISCEGNRTFCCDYDLSNDYIVPIGGGKDSVVTLELLKSSGNVRPLLLNPRKAMTDTLLASGLSLDESIELHRTLNPELLRLNEKGYLNGHTPFSALLAFQTLVAAYLSGIKNIALSNEGSANESTIPGTDINHQYSKTYTFEKDFRNYVSTYISPSFNYFSFLRPLKELQIAGLFSQFPQHYFGFRSCNVGSKTDIWCGHCPKCLFSWIILSPYLGEETLFSIFGKKLLDDPEMSFYLDQLAGLTEEKPFECIGTIEEVKLALFLIRERNPVHVPLLVEKLWESGRLPEYSVQSVASFFASLDDTHFLSAKELELLETSVACLKF
ncbi:MAG: hypothetical protein WCO63_12225 [Bacteroidota bacterium]